MTKLVLLEISSSFLASPFSFRFVYLFFFKELVPLFLFVFYLPALYFDIGFLLHALFLSSVFLFFLNGAEFDIGMLRTTPASA